MAKADRKFNQLFFRRGVPRFCAFDLLWLDGRDLRQFPLIERKRLLRSVIPQLSPHVLYVDHIESEGERLFRLTCEEDLEGVVAKHRQSKYRLDTDRWIKIKNRHYTQAIGRSEFFNEDKRGNSKPPGRVGWAVCTRVSAELR